MNTEKKHGKEKKAIGIFNLFICRFLNDIDSDVWPLLSHRFFFRNYKVEIEINDELENVMPMFFPIRTAHWLHVFGHLSDGFGFVFRLKTVYIISVLRDFFHVIGHFYSSYFGHETLNDFFL